MFTEKTIKFWNNFCMEGLYKAYYDCRRKKRNTKNAIDFEMDLEKNILNLYDDLKNGKYEIGRHICFIARYPKPREIFAANFRDRIIHHLLCAKIEPIISPSFVYNSCACQKNKGVLFAQNRLYGCMQQVSKNFKQESYYLQMDIKSFFMSINKDVLWEILDKKIIEGFYKDLLKQVIYNNPTLNYHFRGNRKLQELIPKYKSLFYAPENVGLPIGNLTSQFFANVYLNELDNYVKRELKCKYYVRYVDDFVLLSKNKEELKIWRTKIKQFVREKLSLEIHPNKVIMQEISQGIDFVGAILKPYHRYARSRIFGNMENVLRKLDKQVLNISDKVLVKENNLNVNTKTNTLHLIPNTYNNTTNTYKKRTLAQLNSYIGFMKHTSYKNRLRNLYRKYFKTINTYFSFNPQKMCFILRE